MPDDFGGKDQANEWELIDTPPADTAGPVALSAKERQAFSDLWESYGQTTETKDGEGGSLEQLELSQFLEASDQMTQVLAEMIESAEINVDEAIAMIKEQQDECIAALSSLMESIDWDGEKQYVETTPGQGFGLKIAREASLIHRVVLEESEKRSKILAGLSNDDPRVTQHDHYVQKDFKRLVKGRHFQSHKELIIEFYSAMLRDEAGAAIAIARENEIRYSIIDIDQKIDFMLERQNIMRNRLKAIAGLPQNIGGRVILLYMRFLGRNKN